MAVPSDSNKPKLEDGKLSDAPRERVPAAHVNAAVEHARSTLAFDREAGWPPRVRGMKDVRPVPIVRWDSGFTPRVQQKHVETARKHPEVRALLDGRAELLGCHLLSPKHDGGHSHLVRVCFANYTHNHLVDVRMRDGVVERVRKLESHAHPEAPIEMAQAIAIARNDATLRASVQQLHAHAILQTPDPSSSYRDDRCLLVMFTDAADKHLEREVLYSALVDLHLQTVISAGQAPCSAKGEKR